MDIYLIRHGRQASPLCNVDVELAEEGREQAGLAGRRLQSYGIQELYSSELIRAKETAEIIGEQIGLENRILKDVEEIHFGDWQGRSDEEISTLYGDMKRKLSEMRVDVTYPGGENGEACAGRAVAALYGLARRCEAEGVERVAVVTHGGLIRSVLAAIFDGCFPKRYLFARNLENCGITQLHYDGNYDRFSLERLNDYAHLEGHDELLRKHFHPVVMVP